MSIQPSALRNLGRGQVCVRTIRDAQQQEPFLGVTYPDAGNCYGNGGRVLEASRRRYGRKLEEVEAKLSKWQLRSIRKAAGTA